VARAVRGRVRPATGAASSATPQAAPKVKKNKRHSVGVGDFVTYSSSNSYMNGTAGFVIAVLNKSRVVVKTSNPGDLDYKGYEVVVRTSKPRDNRKAAYFPYIQKVIVRAAPKPLKKPKPAQPVLHITTHDQLVEHLTSETTKQPVVLNLPIAQE
jgi:hypothetical protein